LKALGGDRITGLLDSVGGPLVPSLFPMLAPGGRVIAYGVQDPRTMEIERCLQALADAALSSNTLNKRLRLLGIDTKTDHYAH
jgi:NADPH:quinone reductase-like Zn-dependent oxidoreductase